MALGKFRLFQFKSKKQIEEEAREYAKWAFPYGDLQKENLSALVKELMPKESIKIALATFLTCKELYENAYNELESRDEAIEKMINVTKSYDRLISEKDMTMYLALVLADADINDSCEYPPVNEITDRIHELNGLKKRPRWRLFN